MGINNLWDSVRPASERKSLQTLASSFYRKNPNRLLRIGIDTSIWLKQCATSTAGPTMFYPWLELQTFLYKLASLFNVGVQVLLVFDGPARPAVKRGKLVRGRSMPHERTIEQLADAFGFQWVKAPAEAEAELAVLQQKGEIDLILSDDADTLVFGATWVMRNHSKNLSGTGAQKSYDQNNDTVDHEALYTLFRSEDIRDKVELTHGGLVLMALMSGGDYEPGGVERCGHSVSSGLAKCGFGESLVENYHNLRHNDLDAFKAWLNDWREELKEELKTNSRGLCGRRNPAIANNLPDTFPALETLDNYVQPVTTLTRPEAAKTFDWSKPFDLPALINFVTTRLFWEHQDIMRRLKSDKCVWPGIILRQLLQRDTTNILKIARDRAHASTGMEHEYRLELDMTTYEKEVQACLVHPDPNIGKLAECSARARAAKQSELDDDEQPVPSQSSKKDGESSSGKPMLWMLASLLRIGALEMTEEFEEKKEEKYLKKMQAQERKEAKARGDRLPSSPVKTKKKTTATAKAPTVTAPLPSTSREAREVGVSSSDQSEVEDLPQPARARSHVSRSSPTLDDFFSSQKTVFTSGKGKGKDRDRTPMPPPSRSSTVDTVIDLCSSPERPSSPPTPKRISPPKEKARRAPLSDSDSLTNVNGREAATRRSPKKKQAYSSSKSRAELTLADKSFDSSDDESLPSLPDLTSKVGVRNNSSKTTCSPGQNATLSFSSTKSTASFVGSSKSKAGRGVAAASTSQIKAGTKGPSKPIYIELDE